MSEMVRAETMQTEGQLFRSVNKGDKVQRASMTPQAVWGVVDTYASQLDLDIAPHNLRRTFAKLARKSGSDLQQIQLSLGHASVKTTEAYLGETQNLTDAPVDRLGLQITRD